MDEIIRRLVSQRQRLVGEERKLCDTGVSIAKYQDREELINLLNDVLELLKEQADQQADEAATETQEYCERYEPTYNPEDGSL